MRSGLMWVTRVKKGYPESEGQGEFWRATMIEPRTRLRVVHGIGEDETEAAIEVFQTLKRRGHSEPRLRPFPMAAVVDDGSLWEGAGVHRDWPTTDQETA